VFGGFVVYDEGMNEKQVRAAAVVALLLLLGWGAYMLYGFKRAFGVQDQRVVQILRSPNGKHEAQLTWRYAFLDLNFLIDLNGERIYTSPDFDPQYILPFRETLLWDESGRYLIFEVNGQRLWGYDVFNKKPLTPAELRTIKIPKVKSEDLGFQAPWPDKTAD
jgi:hypothetical protein